jgi:hypothetical protein
MSSGGGMAAAPASIGRLRHVEEAAPAEQIDTE